MAVAPRAKRKSPAKKALPGRRLGQQAVKPGRRVGQTRASGALPLRQGNYLKARGGAQESATTSTGRPRATLGAKQGGSSPASARVLKPVGTSNGLGSGPGGRVGAPKPVGPTGNRGPGPLGMKSMPDGIGRGLGRGTAASGWRPGPISSGRFGGGGIGGTRPSGGMDTKPKRLPRQ